ncbi:MalY/PatB family protein [Butyrivibrio sp. INlla16]|uniref:MalY/PatB family protein n=1 Tax=Butyrivibrio sp. INlla16 TaxID=1520807 RepID=UPI00088B44ED|nr:MalY/PatB family protein [Butyrivibrio sp. INlla16]SDB28071.1 cystathione beta-lyase [Butyrivibrio sp. INlla16]
MTIYNFDKIVDRKNTSSLKYDFGPERKKRDDLLPLWVADMDFKLPDEVIEDIEKRVKHGIFGYTDPKDDYKTALRNWYLKRHGFEIKDNWNVLTPGVVYAIATAIRALTDKGDAILIQQPVYYPFAETVKQNGRKLVNNQLVYKNGHYEIDFDDFEKKIISENVKLFLLCSPHNPVGRVWTKDELTRIADICKKHDVYVFADEIHSDFIYKGNKHTPYISLGEEYTGKLIVGTSPSKTFNIAGLQIANIIIPNEEIRRVFVAENEAAGYSQCNAVGLTATMSAYTKGEKWLDELIEYLEGNVSYVKDFLKEKLPQIHLIEPEGTYLIWLDFSEFTDNHKELEKLIVDEAHLWLDPGIIFGRETALFERINIACPRKILEQAMTQLYEGVRNHDSSL